MEVSILQAIQELEIQGNNAYFIAEKRMHYYPTLKQNIVMSLFVL